METYDHKVPAHYTLASMHYKMTTVGFYDAMSAEQVDYILN